MRSFRHLQLLLIYVFSLACALFQTAACASAPIGGVDNDLPVAAASTVLAVNFHAEDNLVYAMASDPGADSGCHAMNCELNVHAATPAGTVPGVRYGDSLAAYTATCCHSPETAGTYNWHDKVRRRQSTDSVTAGVGMSYKSGAQPGRLRS